MPRITSCSNRKPINGWSNLFTLDDDSKLPMDNNLPALAFHSGIASVSEDPEVVFSGRPFRNTGPCKGVAIPFYEGDRITNILTLLL